MAPATPAGRLASPRWHRTLLRPRRSGARLALACALLALALAAPAAAAGPGGAGSPASAMPFSGPAVDSEKLALVHSGGMLRVLDAVQLANPQKTPVHQVSLPLAAGAEDVMLRSGGGAGTPRVTGDALVVPLVLGPQSHVTLTYSYAIAAPRLPARLVRTITYPTAQFAVVMRADQAALAAGSLAPLGTASLDGIKVRQYGAVAVPPGMVLALTLEPPPSWLAQAASAFTPTVWMFVAAAALAAVLLLGLRREGMLPWAGGGTEAPR